MNNDQDRALDDTPHGTIGHSPVPSQPEATSPTFPAEAVSLLQHLNLGATRSAITSTPPGTFPTIPNYEIESELGKGGMGVVYKARHATLHHRVAVKMILTSAHASPGEVARFVAEAEAIAAVKHPNVVQVYDLGDSGGCPYFVMEYVAGGNLASVLKKEGPLDPTRAAELIETVARGVQAAHDAGIVHRDLKPANILLAAASEDKTHTSCELPAAQRPLLPKVSDFGLAKRLSSDLTRTQAVMGTPQYMAPEQAGGKAKFVGPQADVYALGVILYECLTGTVPFEAADPWSLIRQVVDDVPEAPRKRMPFIPRDLELICLKCLEKDPHHRYLTATALADDLRRFLNGEPVSVRPIGLAIRAIRWAKKRPAAAGLAALGVLIALAGPAVAVWVQGRFDRRAAVADEAQQKEEEANRARDAAEKARVAAEQLAEARELFGLQTRLRNRESARPLGWTAANLAELPKAVALARGDPAVLEDLRSAAADALLAPDLFPLEPVAPGMTGCPMAVHPKTKQIAIGEFKGWGAARVLFIDPATGKCERVLSYPTPLIDVAQDGTRSIAFTPDAKYLFVGTRSSKVFRFDLEKPENAPALMWKASSGTVEQLVVSPNGKTLYGICNGESPVFAWDPGTGKRFRTFVPDNNAIIRSFSVLPSGELLAGTGWQLYRWRPDGTRAALVDIPGQRLALTAGSVFLVGDGPVLRIFDRETGVETDRFVDPNLRIETHEEYLKAVVVHPSGAFVATAAGNTDRTVKVWELASGRLVGTVVSPGTTPISLMWSSDGRILFATSAGYVSRWKFAPTDTQWFACVSANGLEAATLLGDRSAALSAFCNGQRQLLVGTTGISADTISLTDTGGNGRAGLVAGPDGTLAATLSCPGIFYWKPGTPVPPLQFTKHISWSPRFSPHGTELWAIVDAKEVQSFDPLKASLNAKWRNSLGEVVSGLASFDVLAVGRSLAVAGGPEGTVLLLDPKTCEPLERFRPTAGPILSAALTPDDSLALAGTQQGKLRLIRTADKTELPAIPAHASRVSAIAVNHDGTLVATGGRDRTVRLWKRTGDRLEPLYSVSDLPGIVRELQFSPTDGRLLVLLTNDHAIRVWDTDRLHAQLKERNLGW